jgi:hypothetical protein
MGRVLSFVGAASWKGVVFLAKVALIVVVLAFCVTVYLPVAFWKSITGPRPTETGSSGGPWHPS